MGKFVIVAFACLALSGCGAFERAVAGWTGVSRVCVDGVLYLQFVSGVSVAYNADGKIKQCGD